MRHVRQFTSVLLVLSVVAVSGCLEKKEELAEIIDSSNSGSTFTASDISGGSSKTWTSACTAYNDPVLGTAYYKQILTLQSDGVFSLQHYAYTTPGTNNLSPCANPDYNTIFFVAGAYSVGSAVANGIQAIAFVVATSSLMVTDSLTTNHTNTQNIFNTDCGGTSPYCTLNNGTCSNNGINPGAGQNSANMLCQNFTFANANTTLYNIGSYSNGVLTLGAGLTGLPGVTNANSLSNATPAITFQ